MPNGIKRSTGDEILTDSRNWKHRIGHQVDVNDSLDVPTAMFWNFENYYET